MTDNDTLPHDPFDIKVSYLHNIFKFSNGLLSFMILFHLSDLSPKPGNMPTLLQTFTFVKWNSNL
jgi:hypothetical protein